MTKPQKSLMQKAGALLLDASGMLRLEAQEWLDRKSSPPKYWTDAADAQSWADKCKRVAEINIAAATSMTETARRVATVIK